MPYSDTIDREETLLTIALGHCLGISLTNQKQILDDCGSAVKARESFPQIDAMLPKAKTELDWAEKNHVQCIPYTSPLYPERLRHCADAPVILYYIGNADLNARHIISMVGTRRITEYGKTMCQRLVQEIKALVPDTLIISGLAYGVDVHCHRAALSLGMSTIGVLAHGLNQIYPQSHRQTAAQMTSQGGLLTEFPSSTHIDKRNFVQRNRIVAGMSDAVVVVESAAKGGSLITAELAQDYDREVFAVPGRITDPYSAGTNRLIINNIAHSITCGQDIIDILGWEVGKQQLEMDFDYAECTMHNAECSGDPILFALSQAAGSTLSISDLSDKTNIAIGPLRGRLMTMEMKGLVRMLPGNRCSLV